MIKLPQTLPSKPIINHVIKAEVSQYPLTCKGSKLTFKPLYSKGLKK